MTVLYQCFKAKPITVLGTANTGFPANPQNTGVCLPAGGPRRNMFYKSKTHVIKELFNENINGRCK